MSNNLNLDKYLNSVLYFIRYCNNIYLGKVKLNKLMYYLDFVSYRDNEKSLTGDNYIHKDYGPVPDKIDDILTNLVHQNKIKVEKEEIDKVSKWRFSAIADPKMEVFEKNEKLLLEKMCVTFSDWNTDKIVTQTHLESPWLYSKPYTLVDYDYAFDIDVI